MPLSLPTTLSPSQIDTIAKILERSSALGVSIKWSPPISEGPIVSIYRFVPVGTTRISNCEAIAGDLALALGVEDTLVRRRPGETCVSIAVPHAQRKLVSFTEAKLWARPAAGTITNTLPIQYANVPLVFGVDELGSPFIEDLASLPHLLIAGTTGSGKSTLLASLLAHLIFDRHPSEVQLVLSDTKGVEFRHFMDAPHLRYEVATSVFQTLDQWDQVINEMEHRLKIFGKASLRNIHEYNDAASQGGSAYMELPFIIVVVDELADLLTDTTRQSADDDSGGKARSVQVGKLASQMLSKIVQKARAAGVYVIASTQRPSVDVVKGVIKANFPARLTFRLPSRHDSVTIIGEAGAEHLLAQGDMLFLSPNRPGAVRLHAPYATLAEIDACVEAAAMRA